MTKFCNKLYVWLCAFLAIVAVCLCMTGCGGAAASSDALPSDQPSNAEASSPAEDATAASPESTPGELDEQDVDLPEDSLFKVTFLDVGQGDCAIIECDGHCMMIDGGPPDASQTVYTYIKNQGITHMDYMVATHADTDHVGGLAAALQRVTVDRAFCSVLQADKKAFQSFVKHLGQKGVSLEVPTLGATFTLGSAQVQVIGPLHTDTKDNDDSLVIRITYGQTSFLFAGDASEEEEGELARGAYPLKADVLKVAHHGSAYSSTSLFLRKVSPAVAVISVGKDNSYGHPAKDALGRLASVGASIYRTDLQGDVTVVSDGLQVAVEVEKNSDADTATAPSEVAAAASSATRAAVDAAGGGYIGNISSKKFHSPYCKTLPEEKNRVYFDTREQAIAEGYAPCDKCNP